MRILQQNLPEEGAGGGQDSLVRLYMVAICGDQSDIWKVSLLPEFWEGFRSPVCGLNWNHTFKLLILRFWASISFPIGGLQCQMERTQPLLDLYHWTNLKFYASNCIGTFQLDIKMLNKKKNCLITNMNVYILIVYWGWYICLPINNSIHSKIFFVLAALYRSHWYHLIRVLLSKNKT